MDWSRRQKKWIRLLEMLTVMVILLLAIGSFLAAAHPHQGRNIVIGFLSPAPIPRLFAGMLLSAINPLQIPFWFAWSTVFFPNTILHPPTDHSTLYIACIV